MAEIVASTMNNYILFGRRLICEVMKAEAVDEHIWKGANRKFHVVNTAEKAANTMNARKSPDEVKTTLQKKLEKIQMQIDEMKASGKDSSVLEETNKSYKEALAALEKEGKKKEKVEKKVEKETKKEAKSEKKEDKKEKKDKEMKKDKKEKMEKPVKRNPKTKKVVKM